VATERRWKDDEGHDHKETGVASGGRLRTRWLKHCNNYLVKGRLVYIEGRLQPESFVVMDPEAQADRHRAPKK